LQEKEGAASDLNDRSLRKQGGPEFGLEIVPEAIDTGFDSPPSDIVADKPATWKKPSNADGTARAAVC